MTTIDNEELSKGVTFKSTLSEIAYECWQIAEDHGWHTEVDTVPAKLLLMHSEISEATEEFRDNNLRYELRNGKPEGLVVELADCIIRIFDLCGVMNLDIEHAILGKMDYNRTRPIRHGGKAI